MSHIIFYIAKRSLRIAMSNRSWLPLNGRHDRLIAGGMIEMLYLI